MLKKYRKEQRLLSSAYVLKTGLTKLLLICTCGQDLKNLFLKIIPINLFFKVLNNENVLNLECGDSCTTL